MSGSNQKKMSKSGHDVTPLPEEVVRQLSADLDPLAYTVTMESGTESAFSGKYWDAKADGTYVCAVCGLPVFSSGTKFDSGSGWPSYHAPFDPEHLLVVEDHIGGMIRSEVRCARSGSHLGHLFADGPAPTGMRYCINSAALDFVPRAMPIPTRADSLPTAAASVAGIVSFGAGCFWGVEAAFRRVAGITATRVGYSGGTVEEPTYEQVCGGSTGHAEAVEVRFDPEAVDLTELLEVFWSCHDPTQLDRQGPDVGSQYRSVIFYHNEAQRLVALAARNQLQRSGRFARPIVTEIVTAGPFHPAEEYHQQYLEKTGKGGCTLPQK